MYVYTENGILIDRISYQELSEKYGKPISVSENGLILIFRNGHDNPEIHLLFVHINKLEYVETINIKKKLDIYFENLEKDPDHDKDIRYHEKCMFYQRYLHKMEKMNLISLKFWLNDDAEVLVRIYPATFEDRRSRSYVVDKEFGDI